MKSVFLFTDIPETKTNVVFYKFETRNWNNSDLHNPEAGSSLPEDVN